MKFKYDVSNLMCLGSTKYRIGVVLLSTNTGFQLVHKPEISG